MLAAVLHNTRVTFAEEGRCVEPVGVTVAVDFTMQLIAARFHHLLNVCAAVLSLGGVVICCVHSEFL